MAMHDLGYRSWLGRRAPAWTCFVVIATTGVRRTWQSRWLRRMLLFAWLPALWFGLGFFIWEQSLLHPEWREALGPFLAGGSLSSELSSILRDVDLEDPTGRRHAIWAWLLQSFFRYPQSVLMVMVVGLITPPLISQDIRSRAFLLYFSNPITPGEYILGKLTTVWVYLALISTLPAVALYLLGVLLSPQLDVIQATWDLPFRILAASAVLMIPTASLALCLSSLTQESRYAGFGWFAIWILGWFTYGVLTFVETNGQREPLRSEVGGWSHLSLYHTLGRVQSWIFGFSEWNDVWLSAVILLAVTVISLVIMFRRVVAPMHV